MSLRVRDGDTTDSFIVSGRGEMHLSILVENMRREGYELALSTPKVIMKEIDGKLCEPIEHLYIDVTNDYVGAVVEKLNARKGELLQHGSPRQPDENGVYNPHQMSFRLPFPLSHRHQGRGRDEFAV